MSAFVIHLGEEIMVFSSMDKQQKKKVFVSFDYDNDRKFKYLLEAWDANPNFEFVFKDLTPDEIFTNDIGRIKAALTAKINQSTHTLVIVGKYANSRHRDASEIGFKNWINFEVHQSKANQNKLVAVFLNLLNEAPDEFSGYPVKYLFEFNEKPILDALN